MENEYPKILARVRKHARLLVEAAENIDTRAMNTHVFELRELQQEMICLEIVSMMTPEERAKAESEFEAINRLTHAAD
jgi:hypothetical protein